MTPAAERAMQERIDRLSSPSNMRQSCQNVYQNPALGRLAAVFFQAHEEAKERSTKTPLGAALWNREYDTAKTLLESGADYSECVEEIVKTERLDLIDLLDVNKQDAKGNTPIFYAIKNSRYESIVKWLLEEKGVDINAKDAEGKTILFYATKLEFVKYLVNQGADVNAKDDKDMTPLLHYLLNVYVPSLTSEGYSTGKFLIQKGAAVNARDRYGRCVLFVCVDRKIDKLLPLIINKGADVQHEYSILRVLDLRDFAKHIAGLRFLIQNGLDVNVKHRGSGDTLLHKVCRSFKQTYKKQTYRKFDEKLKQVDLECLEKMFNELLDAGAKVNITNNNSQTPLALLGEPFWLDDVTEGFGLRRIYNRLSAEMERQKNIKVEEIELECLAYNKSR